ncbi:EAL domain-containing protein [Nitriliruptoraceae bacterium ZYF776]|nr:EAL domain-containing protein [Profundirhabdus halotolerans]
MTTATSPSSGLPPGRRGTSDRGRRGTSEVGAAVGRASEAELRAIVQLAPVGIGIVDLEGRTVLTNSKLREMLGYSEDEFATLHWAAFTHPDDVDRNLELFGAMVEGRSERFEMDKRFVHKDGHQVWGRLTVSLLRDDRGAPAYAIGMTEDITEQRQLEEQLREAESTFRLLVEQSPAVVYVAPTDLTRRWHYISPQLQRTIGVSAEEWLADPGLWWLHVNSVDLPEVMRRVDEVSRLGTDEPHVLHYRMRHRAGHQVWIRDEFRLVTGPDGVPVFRGVLVDVTREKELEADLERQASHDPLTGLANRDLLARRIASVLARQRPGRRHDAVVFIDLDDFKTVNDSLGHAAGDELLRSVADRIRIGLRPGDTAGRLGGDEFALLLEDLDDPRDAIAIAERLRDAVEVPHDLSGRPVQTSASFGIAMLGEGGTVETVLRDADLAMYRAKELGKGRVACYEPSLHAAAVRRLDLRSELGGALARGELAVHLQPIVDLASGDVTAYEALLRWEHPAFGAVPPADFIPIAEETGTIHRLGAWVLRESCVWLADQHAAGHEDLAIEVNVSPRQLEDPSFGGAVAEVLRETGLRPAALVLEITEQALMSPSAWQELEELSALGVRIAVDDFGTGYASLAYLGALAVDVLKIDRTFVEQLGRDTRSRAVPQAIVQLAASLGLEVIAEGVETSCQLQALRELGCHRGQGYLFAPPAGRQQAEGQLSRPAPAPHVTT